MPRIERALLSVSDKTGLVEFANGLVRMGVKLLSSGGTARALREAGIDALEISDHTGAPEILGGRVKTLHPKIHGGILARTQDPEHRRDLEEQGIEPIDLVATNLYPFEKTVGGDGATLEKAIEEIDIGGVTLLRAAAKNHERVAVIPDPKWYGPILEEMERSGGSLSAETRRELALAAFRRTAAYDMAIAAYLSADEALPDFLPLILRKDRDLRYGENPHQRAALYRPAGAAPAARILGGKDLSYNNLLDLSSASALAADLDGPGCAIVKHTNPCGAAVGETPAAAFGKALEADPVSAFGSIVAFNRPLDAETAREIVSRAGFIEAVTAPEIAPAAADVLRGAKWGKSVRILEGGPPAGTFAIRSAADGILAQEGKAPAPREDVMSSRSPSPEEWHDLRFAWKVAGHVKSNAIVLARGGATVGIGAGQMSRVDAVRIAVEKAGDRARGAVLASDGFFPFPDGIEAAAAAGVTAAIHPGGSKRDAEVIEAADRLGVALVATGVRLFLH